MKFQISIPSVSVILFKPSGKFYTEEYWRMPPGENEKTFTHPSHMIDSPDFRTIGGGPVLVESQAPWGFPWLILRHEVELRD